MIYFSENTTIFKILFLQVLVGILSLGSGFVDPHTFSGPDPGSQNVAIQRIRVLTPVSEFNEFKRRLKSLKNRF